ncbi:MAG: alpha/beta hydrolase [Sphingobacteriaceae bacterium]|nr:MAG: alpha/beta hydrolase [Sphingobacteriaceae bacterium]
MPDFEIIAFDAPGNGSSEGDLSNLLLFILAIKAVITFHGKPDVVIGHSLGAMANIAALGELGITPSILISVTPLLRLKENFEFSMNKVGIPLPDQTTYFDSFKEKFDIPISDFKLDNWYGFNNKVNHWLAYDVNDPIAPHTYLETFAASYPSVKLKNYTDIGHHNAIKSPVVVSDLVQEVISAVA